MPQIPPVVYPPNDTLAGKLKSPVAKVAAGAAVAAAGAGAYAWSKMSETADTLHKATTAIAPPAESNTQVAEEAAAVKDSQSPYATTKTPPPGSIRGAVDKVLANKTTIDKNIQGIHDADIQKANASFTQAIAQAQSLSEARTDDVRKAEMWTGIAEGLTLIAAGMYGAKNGIDPSGIRFNKHEWQAEYDRIATKLRDDITTAKSQREANAGSAEKALSASERASEFEASKAIGATTADIQNKQQQYLHEQSTASAEEREKIRASRKDAADADKAAIQEAKEANKQIDKAASFWTRVSPKGKQINRSVQSAKSAAEQLAPVLGDLDPDLQQVRAALEDDSFGLNEENATLVDKLFIKARQKAKGQSTGGGAARVQFADGSIHEYPSAEKAQAVMSKYPGSSLLK